MTNEQIVQQYYIAYYGRPADTTGLDFWVGALEDGMAESDLIASFGSTEQAEFAAIYGGDVTPEEFFTIAYDNMLNRTPDAEGMDFWMGVYDGYSASGMSEDEAQAQLIIDFVGGISGGSEADQALWNNKMALAEETTALTDGLTDANANELVNSVRDGAFQNPDLGDADVFAAAQEDLQNEYQTIIESPDQGQSLTLTPTTDVFTMGEGATGATTDGADIIRGVAGQFEGAQDQTTLNSSDFLDGAGGEDRLVINMTGQQYLGGATIKNIETLQIGSNLPVSAFDMNVNQGAYEVSGVQTLTFDQITTGETLTVQNVVPVAEGDVTPTLRWANENGSAAGTAAVTYRQASIDAADDNQDVVLHNVDATQAQGSADGTLLIAGGIETLTITSTGAIAQNTLNNVQDANPAYADTGINATQSDLNSRGSLTTVVLQSDSDDSTADAAIGRAAQVITDTSDANYGLTDRQWLESDDPNDGDLGLTTGSTASNLLSVGARVTTIDATDMTADTSVRFTAKTDGTGTDVTFEGGSANDYVEFELGAVTANGNAGDDTFAFINTTNNSTFGSTDSIDGGEGTDTIQIGVNGQAQTYNISATEFNNKGSIEVVDLRGSENNVTLSQEFVEAADEKLTVRTDRVVQTSDENPDNDLINTTEDVLTLEDGMVTTLNTTNLDQNTGLVYLGGSGSDRLVLDNESFNQYVDLDGGANRGEQVVAAGGDYDTLTVKDSAVLDSGDLANVENFEGMVLVKTQAAAQFDIEMTEAFLLANTTGDDFGRAYPDTSISDQTFFIGTSNAAQSYVLTDVDVVNIDISDLLTDDGILKTSLSGRGLDITSLEDAGVTVNYIVDGVELDGNDPDDADIITAVTRNDTADERDDVVVESPANPRDAAAQNIAPTVNNAAFDVAADAAADTPVGRIVAADADGTVTDVAITAGNSDADGDGIEAFVIQTVQGQAVLAVADADDLGAAGDTFTLTVQATDDLGATGAGTITVTVEGGVVGNAPVVQIPQQAVSVEATAAAGDTVLQVELVDADGINTLDQASLTITGLTPGGQTVDLDNNGDGTDPFALQGLTPVDANTATINLVVADADDVAALAGQTFGLNVSVDDTTGLSGDAQVAVTVSDEVQEQDIDLSAVADPTNVPGREDQADSFILDFTLDANGTPVSEDAVVNIVGFEVGVDTLVFQNTGATTISDADFIAAASPQITPNQPGNLTQIEFLDSDATNATAPAQITLAGIVDLNGDLVVDGNTLFQIV